mmetsp:Transcript_15516/g.46865  ORF Transcript_15516/g.46865 Transcript_15516/m.46865 type:complete len:570 (+) Transcript_15516:249-1958(+)
MFCGGAFARTSACLAQLRVPCGLFRLSQAVTVLSSSQPWHVIYLRSNGEDPSRAHSSAPDCAPSEGQASSFFDRHYSSIPSHSCSNGATQRVEVGASSTLSVFPEFYQRGSAAAQRLTGSATAGFDTKSGAPKSRHHRMGSATKLFDVSRSARGFAVPAYMQQKQQHGDTRRQTQWGNDHHIDRSRQARQGNSGMRGGRPLDLTAIQQMLEDCSVFSEQEEIPNAQTGRAAAAAADVRLLARTKASSTGPDVTDRRTGSKADVKTPAAAAKECASCWNCGAPSAARRAASAPARAAAAEAALEKKKRLRREAWEARQKELALKRPKRNYNKRKDTRPDQTEPRVYILRDIDGEPIWRGNALSITDFQGIAPPVALEPPSAAEVAVNAICARCGQPQLTNVAPLVYLLLTLPSGPQYDAVLCRLEMMMRIGAKKERQETVVMFQLAHSMLQRSQPERVEVLLQSLAAPGGIGSLKGERRERRCPATDPRLLEQSLARLTEHMRKCQDALEAQEEMLHHWSLLQAQIKEAAVAAAEGDTHGVAQAAAHMAYWRRLVAADRDHVIKLLTKST